MSFENPNPTRILIVHNPAAGSARREALVGDLVACIARLGLEPEIVADLDALRARADEYTAGSQLRAIVAAGGDGTVATVVNHMAPGTPVTVFPLGTANLLASYLGTSRDPQVMAQLLREGAAVRLDAGQANGRVFLIMAGCGFDADVVHRLHGKREGGHISYWTWAGPILDSIRRYPFHDLRVYCDVAAGAPAEPTHSARWAFVVNLPLYAAGLRVAPRAVGTDGKLDVCTFSRGSLWHGLRYVGHVALGRHHKLTDFKSTLASRVRIESDDPVPYQLDGDPGGQLPLDIEVLPGRLTLWTWKTRARELGIAAARTSEPGA
jgi:diacylglycerol kinase family enzyme